MFWLPRKTIYKGPRLQRGNIVFTTGLPPSRLVDVNGNYVDDGTPSGGGGWTLDQAWETNLGDLDNIDNAFQASGGRARASTVAWSPDGTKLTLSSSSSDDTKCFECSTPFDPGTASQIFSYAVTNPSWGHYNKNGTRWVENTVVGDQYVMYTANGWVITNGTPLVGNIITKNNMSFNASSDSPAVFGNDFEYMLWYGRNNTFGDAMRNVTTPAADLGSYIIVDDGYQALNINGNAFSNLDKSETIWMVGSGSSGVAFNQLAGKRDVVSNIIEGTPQDIRSLGPDIRPGAIWFDPDDTRYVWVTADPSANFQMARYATNVPESL